MIKSSLSFLLLIFIVSCGPSDGFVDIGDPIDPFEIESRSQVKANSELESVETLEVSSTSAPDMGDVIQGLIDRLQNGEEHRLSYLNHNSLFDVVKDDQNVKGTTSRLLEKIAAEPEAFVGQNVNLSLTNDGSFSHLGPVGEVARNEQGKKYFKVTDDRESRRKNAILGVFYEEIKDVGGNDKVFEVNLLFYVHSDWKGHFFHRRKVKIDWINKTANNGPTVTVMSRGQDIDLSQTNFKVHVELATLKAIIVDYNNDLKMVVPITAGAMDVRNGLDDEVNSMTLLLPYSGGKYDEFDLHNSYLVKQEIWSSHANTSSRVQPSYYRGRPFLAIVDFSQIDDQQALENAGRGLPTNVGSGYRHIGFHYMIDDSGLKRGFESHGCIRIQDRELYMLNSIVNYGPRNLTPVEVKKVLPYFSEINTVYKTQEKYEKVVYSSKEPSPRVVHCLQGAPYPVRFFENKEGTKRMHTLADKDCLSQLSGAAGNMKQLQAYLLGDSQYIPALADWGDAEHIPIKLHNQFLKENKQTLIEVKPEYAQFAGYELDKVIEEMEQKEKRDLVALLKPQVDSNATNGIEDTITQVLLSASVSTDNWPVIGVISSHPRLREYSAIYDTHCTGKKKNWNLRTPRRERPGIRNCEAFYDVLIKYGTP